MKTYDLSSPIPIPLLNLVITGSCVKKDKKVNITIEWALIGSQCPELLVVSINSKLYCIVITLKWAVIGSQCPELLVVSINAKLYCIVITLKWALINEYFFTVNFLSFLNLFVFLVY